MSFTVSVDQGVGQKENTWLFSQNNIWLCAMFCSAGDKILIVDFVLQGSRVA